MSSVFNKIANAVTGQTSTTNPSHPHDSSYPSGTGSSTDPSGLPAGNQNSGVGSNYAGTNYSATNTGALKEGSQVRDTGINSGRSTDYSTTNTGGLGSGSSLGSTGTGTGLGYRHHGLHHGTGTGIGTSTSTGTSSSLGSSTASSLGSSTASRSGDASSGYMDDAMTRSEEHLLVGKEKVNVGAAALNKYVTTEKVSTAVPIVREKAVVEREPITEANREAAMRGPDFKESHYEVNLMEERAVAEKQTVPIERVRLRKEAEQTQQYVEADLRKEHIELVDPTKEAAGLGGNHLRGGVGKDSSNLTTGSGMGVGSSHSGSNLSSGRQIATDDPTSSASRKL